MSLLDKIDLLYGDPLVVVSNCLRGLVIAKPGHRLLVGDYANIEGRGLAWLAGEEWKLDAFRAYDAGTGPDLYKLAYSRAFQIPVGDVTKDQRQIGKVMELALGYEGGVGAFQKMAAAYGVRLPDEEVDELKVNWRKAHPAIKRYWRALARAAVDATLHPGKKFMAGAEGRETTFLKKGSFLWARLPSGGVVPYPFPRVTETELPWFGEETEWMPCPDLEAAQRRFEPERLVKYDAAKRRALVRCYATGPQLHYKMRDGTTGIWKETTTYGGSLSENLTQALCRDILAEAIVRLEDEGWPVVLHAHDEAVVEIATDRANLPAFEECMARPPAWSKGFPIVVEAFETRRYRKD